MFTNAVLLLKIIDSNASLTLLRKKGLSHSQIAALLQAQVDAGYVIFNETQICLSETGKEVLANSLDSLKLKPKEAWIIPQESYYKEPLSQNAVFLPPKI